MSQESPGEEKQCRICLDGSSADAELGRLIRPCLCRGSISYVHIKCLHRWRNTSPSKNAFFECPQCRYKYRFTRTRIAGIAGNPIIVGGLSSIIFTCIVMAASFITTFFMSAFEEPSHTFYSSFIYVSPFSLAKDLIVAALQILKDEDTVGLFDQLMNSRSSRPRHRPGSPETIIPAQAQHRALFMRFFRRFILGLPMVGAGSLVWMLLSAPFLGPLQWLARQRGGRRRREQSRDIAAIVIVVLLVMGAARALYKVYRATESATQRMLLKAEDAILEVT